MCLLKLITVYKFNLAKTVKTLLQFLAEYYYTLNHLILQTPQQHFSIGKRLTIMIYEIYGSFITFTTVFNMFIKSHLQIITIQNIMKHL